MEIFRPDIKLVLEQPISSYMFKQVDFAAIISKLNLRKVLTYLGLYGHDLEKATHLWLNVRRGSRLARTMNAKNKRRFQTRIEKKKERILSRGGTLPVYYVKDKNGGYHGGPDLAGSAHYPAGFVSAVFRLWETAWIEDHLRQARLKRALPQ